MITMRASSVEIFSRALCTNSSRLPSMPLIVALRVLTSSSRTLWHCSCASICSASRWYSAASPWFGSRLHSFAMPLASFRRAFRLLTCSEFITPVSSESSKSSSSATANRACSSDRRVWACSSASSMSGNWLCRMSSSGISSGPQPLAAMDLKSALSRST